MRVELELWHLITLLLAFFGCVGGFGKLLLRQIEKRLDERFVVLGETSQQVRQLERDFQNWKSEMPARFVLREDYIRGQTVLEAKQDTLYSEVRLIHKEIGELAGRMRGTS